MGVIHTLPLWGTNPKHVPEVPPSEVKNSAFQFTLHNLFLWNYLMHFEEPGQTHHIYLHRSLSSAGNFGFRWKLRSIKKIKKQEYALEKNIIIFQLQKNIKSVENLENTEKQKEKATVSGP